MTQLLATLLAWLCRGFLALIVGAGIYLLGDLQTLQELMSQNLPLPIQWHTIATWQLYLSWMVTALYMAVGLAGVWFLQQALSKFGKGELFTLSNSKYLRNFAKCLLVQSVCGPVHIALLSVLLSANHPAGQKMFSLSISSDDVKILALGFVFWMVSDLLVKAHTLEQENDSFI